MRYLFVFILFLTNHNKLNAQNCDSIGENLVNKIKNTNYKDLIPYYDSFEKKWGLMNKQGIALTEPFSEYVFTFETNLHNTYYIENYKECNIDINYITMEFNAEEYKENNIYYTQETYGVKIPVQDTLNGFTIELYSVMDFKNGEIGKEAEISLYSKRFKEVNKPFYKKNKWYALATLKENSHMGIIDQNGKTIDNFNFNYNKLKQLHYYKGKLDNEIWYYYENLSHKKGFINLEGDTKFKDKLLSDCNFYYDFYCIQKNNKKSGVIDLRNLKWAIKPQQKIKLEKIIQLGDYENDKSEYYIIANKGEDKFLVDLKMKKYIRVNQ